MWSYRLRSLPTGRSFLGLFSAHFFSVVGVFGDEEHDDLECKSHSIYTSPCCPNNLAALLGTLFCRVSNQLGLEAAIEATAELLNNVVKLDLVGGPKLRVAKGQQAFVELADASGYPIAVMPLAKGLVPEQHPQFIGIYWGTVSTSYCEEMVESADAYAFIGPIFNNYSSDRYSLLFKKEK